MSAAPPWTQTDLDAAEWAPAAARGPSGVHAVGHHLFSAEPAKTHSDEADCCGRFWTLSLGPEPPPPPPHTHSFTPTLLCTHSTFLQPSGRKVRREWSCRGTERRNQTRPSKVWWHSARPLGSTNGLHQGREPPRLPPPTRNTTGLLLWRIWARFLTRLSVNSPRLHGNQYFTLQLV